MWIEIHHTSEIREIPTWYLEPRPIKEYEVRLVIWDTKDVVAMDFEGTSDVFFRNFFD